MPQKSAGKVRPQSIIVTAWTMLCLSFFLHMDWAKKKTRLLGGPDLMRNSDSSHYCLFLVRYTSPPCIFLFFDFRHF
jgi:hypothetical protein